MCSQELLFAEVLELNMMQVDSEPGRKLGYRKVAALTPAKQSERAHLRVCYTSNPQSLGSVEEWATDFLGRYMGQT